MNHSTDPLFDSRIAAWLEDDPNSAPDQALETILAAVPSNSQRRRVPVPWRLNPMPNLMKLAAAALVGVIALGVIYLNLPGRTDVGNPTASPSPTSTARPTEAPSPTQNALLDTANWTTYTSGQYDVTISYPPEWTATAASREWTFEADASLDPHSPAMDSFISPNRQVRVSLWAIDGAALPGGLGEVTGPLDDIYAWAENFCRATQNTPCDGVSERAYPMCHEYRDCHPAAMVLYAEDVQAYIPLGDETEPIVVVVVWRADNDPSTVAYGSSKNLLQAFLSTVNGGGNHAVWPMGYLPGDPPVLVTQPPTP